MPAFNRYYTPPGSAVPSSVSRDLDPGEYSWDTVVYQSGRPILDAELNLAQDASEYNRTLLAGKALPSGFIRGQSTFSALNDYAFGLPPGVPVNSFILPRLLANVAGMPVVVEYTGTVTPNANVVTLPAATAYAGLPANIKRTDFVFLEVWRAQVAPSPRAYGYVQIVDSPFAIAPGDTITIDTTVLGGAPVVLAAVAGVPAVGQFQIGANADATGVNFAAAVNNPANGLFPDVTANAHSSSIVQITAGTGGVVGNGVTLAESTAGARIVLSGPNLLNGANRPNKPTQDAIYHHGNVGSPPGVDLPDNLVDPALNVESTQRVQVQYRLRTYSDVAAGINPKTQPDGFSNTNLLAQGAAVAPVVGYPFVPADGVTVTVNSDATAYGFVDNGLYIAGDGTAVSAAALGTVDGFVYAIPVCFAFRRNNAEGTGGFDPASNANGALSYGHAAPFLNSHLETPGPVNIAANASDRPDGLFHDVIAAADVLDLRRHVTPPGYDFGSELKYQTQSLLDATNLSWQVESSDLGTMGAGSGGESTTPMVCDEIARPGSPGSGVFGDRIRTFDHIARRFASQPIVERVIFEVLPNAVSYPVGFAVANSGTGWCEDDTISLDFTALDASTLQDWLLPTAARPVTGNWPVGTKVTDVLVSYHDDGHSTVPVDQVVQFKSITGVGTDVVTVTLDHNPQVTNVAASGTMLTDLSLGVNGSQRRIFLEVEVTYPTGAGLIRTPRAPLTPSASSGYAPYNGGAIIEFDPSQRPTDMVVGWVPQPKFRPPFREVLLEQQTKNVVDSVVTRDPATVYTPRRVSTTVGMLANGVAPVSATVGSSERKVVLGAAAVGQSPVPVNYRPQDPIADYGAVGYRLDVYYQGTAPQTCGVQPGAIPTNLLPHGFTVEPLAVSNHVWTGQTGAGSVDLAFPYAVPLDNIPMANLVPGSDLEWYFAATAAVAVSDFNADTGSLTLHPMVPMDASAPLTLGDVAHGTKIDGEFRAYYDFVNAGGYKSTVMAQPLSGATRHKVFTTMLVRPTTATLLFRPGELVLLVFSRWAVLDADNKVVVADPPVGTASSIVAVFRTKNLLLTAGT
jgi:hypothetical protein